VAFEHFHYLKKRPKHTRKCHMALKLDMSKAYDRIEWWFIEDMKKAMGFCDSFIRLVMGCVTTVSFKVLIMLINGRPSNEFMPQRELDREILYHPFFFSFVLKDCHR